MGRPLQGSRHAEYYILGPWPRRTRLGEHRRSLNSQACPMCDARKYRTTHKTSLRFSQLPARLDGTPRSLRAGVFGDTGPSRRLTALAQFRKPCLLQQRAHLKRVPLAQQAGGGTGQPGKNSPVRGSHPSQAPGLRSLSVRVRSPLALFS